MRRPPAKAEPGVKWVQSIVIACPSSYVGLVEGAPIEQNQQHIQRNAGGSCCELRSSRILCLIDDKVHIIY
jgi:hypothetical protein